MALTDNVLIAHIDYLVFQGVGITGPNTSWPSTLPVTNVGTTDLGEAARALGTSADIAVDLGSSKDVNVLAIPKHNFSSTAEWRVRASNNVLLLTNPGAVPSLEVLYDSTQIVINPVVPSYTSSKYVVNPPALLVLPSSLGPAQYYYIEIIDDNNTETFLDINKLILSPAWQPSNNMEHKWAIQYVDKSKRTYSSGAQLYVDSVPQYRQVTLSFSNFTRIELMKNLAEVDRQLGLGAPILVILKPLDVTNLANLSIYGSQVNLTPLIEPYKNLTKKSLVIQEWT